MAGRLEPYRSFWLDQALGEERFEPQPPLRGQLTADIAIVGGGYLGMWSAYELKRRQPELDVVIIERDICGGGASGRNAGYVISYWSKFLTLAKLCGVDDAIRTCIASDECIGEIGDFIREHGIDARFRRNGWLWGATCGAQMGGWEPIVTELDKYGHRPFEPVATNQLQDGWGLSGWLGGVIERRCADIQPAKLAFGIRRVLLQMGVRIFENSPMSSIRAGKTIDIDTDNGTISATKIILAMNAWGVRFPHIRQQIAVIASEAAISEPAPEWIEKMGWSAMPAMTDSRMRVTNYRTTSDGRVEFGKGGSQVGFGSRVGPKFEGPALGLDGLRSEMEDAIPAAKTLRVAKSWVGPVDRSNDGLPIYSQLKDPRIYYGVGFTGNGVGPSKLGGKILASLLLETNDRWSNSPLVRSAVQLYPPEPVKYVGGKIVREACHRKDQLENQNRKPSLLTRWLADQVKSSLTPQKPRSDL